MASMNALRRRQPFGGGSITSYLGDSSPFSPAKSLLIQNDAAERGDNDYTRLVRRQNAELESLGVGKPWQSGMTSGGVDRSLDRERQMVMDGHRSDQTQLLRGAAPGDIPYTSAEMTNVGQKFKPTTNLNMGAWQGFANHHAAQGMLASNRGNRYGVVAPGGGGKGGSMPGQRTPASYLSGPSGGDKAPGGLPTWMQNKYWNTLSAELADREDAARTATRQRQYDWSMELGDAVQTGQRRAPGTVGERDFKRGQEYLDQDLLNIRADADATRFWDPRQTSKRNEEHRLGVERAVAPAEAQAFGARERAAVEADGRERAARAVADGRRESVAQTVQRLMQSFSQMAEKGAFGQDRRGRPNPPPPELVTEANRLLQDAFASSGGARSPEDEAEIEAAMQEMGVDYITAERELRLRGVIR